MPKDKRVSDLKVSELSLMIKEHTETFAVSKIETVVENTMNRVLTKFGIDVEHPLDVQKNMVFLDKQRRGAEKIVDWSKKSVIVTFITGIVALIIYGFKSWVK